MKNMLRGSVLILSFSVLFCGGTPGAWANPAQAVTEFEYPELMVSPRATERVELELGREKQGDWTMHLPIQFAATTSIVTGVLLLADQAPDKDSLAAGITGLTIGAGWITLTALMGKNYAPYASAQKDLAAMPRKTKREQLLRERLAEERIEAAARAGKRLQWFAVGTTAGAAIYMGANSNGRDSAALTAAGVSVASAFVPLIFPYHWQQVAKEQRGYKKKIYAPLASGAVLAEPSTGNLVPGVLLSFRY